MIDLLIENITKTHHIDIPLLENILISTNDIYDTSIEIIKFIYTKCDSTTLKNIFDQIINCHTTVDKLLMFRKIFIREIIFDLDRLDLENFNYFSSKILFYCRPILKYYYDKYDRDDIKLTIDTIMTNIIKYITVNILDDLIYIYNEDDNDYLQFKDKLLKYYNTQRTHKLKILHDIIGIVSDDDNSIIKIVLDICISSLKNKKQQTLIINTILNLTLLNKGYEFTMNLGDIVYKYNDLFYLSMIISNYNDYYNNFMIKNNLIEQFGSIFIRDEFELLNTVIEKFLIINTPTYYEKVYKLIDYDNTIKTKISILFFICKKIAFPEFLNEFMHFYLLYTDTITLLDSSKIDAIELQLKIRNKDIEYVNNKKINDNLFHVVSDCVAHCTSNLFTLASSYIFEDCIEYVGINIDELNIINMDDVIDKIITETKNMLSRILPHQNTLFFLLNINDTIKNFGHANFLVIDLINKKIERFEPHGVGIDMHLYLKTKPFLNKLVEIQHDNPLYGYEIIDIEKIFPNGTQHIYDIGEGTCSIHALLYGCMRKYYNFNDVRTFLHNDEITISKYIDTLLIWIVQYYLKQYELIEQPLKDYYFKSYQFDFDAVISVFNNKYYFYDGYELPLYNSDIVLHHYLDSSCNLVNAKIMRFNLLCKSYLFCKNAHTHIVTFGEINNRYTQLLIVSINTKTDTFVFNDYMNDTLNFNFKYFDDIYNEHIDFYKNNENIFNEQIKNLNEKFNSVRLYNLIKYICTYMVDYGTISNSLALYIDSVNLFYSIINDVIDNKMVENFTGLLRRNKNTYLHPKKTFKYLIEMLDNITLNNLLDDAVRIYLIRVGFHPRQTNKVVKLKLNGETEIYEISEDEYIYKKLYKTINNFIMTFNFNNNKDIQYGGRYYKQKYIKYKNKYIILKNN